MSRLSPSAKKPMRLLALVAATLLLASCGVTADNAPLDTLGDDLAGPQAQAIGRMMTWVLWITYIVFIGVLGATFLAWKKFRVKGEYEEDDWPEQIHGNTALELFWTAIPAAVLVGVGFFSLGLHNDLNSDQVDEFNVLVEGSNVNWDPQIVVVGQQWWWEYQYHFDPSVDIDQKRIETLPEADITTATQMVIPVGVEIELEITSRDVIHSHWIPSLNGKRDAVPGRQSAPWKIQADEPGVYFGQCTEFCGLSHSRMRMQVVALDAADFNEWVSMQMEGVPLDEATAAFVEASVAGEVPSPVTGAERGVATFRSKCASCHLMEGVAEDLYSQEEVAELLVSGAAPNLTHFSSRTTFAGGIRNVWDPQTGEFNQNDLREWLNNPADVKANAPEAVSEDDTRARGMPALGLSTQEIDDLVALLEATGPKPSDFIIEQTGIEG